MSKKYLSPADQLRMAIASNPIKPPPRPRKRTQPVDTTVDVFCQMIGKEIGVVIEREYQFHATRKWRFDYAIPEHRIAIEVEGGVWTQGRHTRPKGFIGDMDKYNTAATNGWRILRVTPDTLLSLKTLEMIRAAVNT